MITKPFHQLVKMLVIDGDDRITVPSARADICWLAGEFQEFIEPVSTDILRLLAKDYADEPTECKTQILNFAVKAALRAGDEDEVVQSLMTYVLEMARYDNDIDLRDRSRIMTAFMGLAVSAPNADNDEGSDSTEDYKVDEDSLAQFAECAKNVILAPKLPPVTLLGTVDAEGMADFGMGTLSSVVGYFVSGYRAIPSWPLVQADPKVRDAMRSFEGDEKEDSQSDKKGRKYKRDNTSASDSGEDDNLNLFYGNESKPIKESAAPLESDSSSSGSSDENDEVILIVSLEY
jgi:hypothetical protein